MHIDIAQTDQAILRCFPIISQLRPHLEVGDFLPRIRRMQREGFRLAYLEHDGEVRAVAGYRIMEMLVAGRVLYVDDLVTDESARSLGHGAALHQWLEDHARSHGCATLELDSGVHRHGAHRFYFRRRMSIIGYHFSLPLGEPRG